MKPTFSLFGLTALFLIACSGGSDKFTGKWKPITGSRVTTSNYMWIEKIDAKVYHLNFFKYQPSDTIVLSFDDNTDVLTGRFKGEQRVIKYLGDNGHLLATPLDPASKSFDVEYERIKDSL